MNMVMRKKCFVTQNCSNTETGGYKFVTVPATNERLKWFESVMRQYKKFNIKSSFYCCTDHFRDEDYSYLIQHKLTGCSLKVKERVFPRRYKWPVPQDEGKAGGIKKELFVEPEVRLRPAGIVVGLPVYFENTYSNSCPADFRRVIEAGPQFGAQYPPLDWQRTAHLN